MKPDYTDNMDEGDSVAYWAMSALVIIAFLLIFIAYAMMYR